MPGSIYRRRRTCPRSCSIGRTTAPCCRTFGCQQKAYLIAIAKKADIIATWRDAGLLETTSGRAINFKAIIHRLAEIQTQYDLRAIAYDRAFIKMFNAQCEELGVKLPLKEMGQGFTSHSVRPCNCSRPPCSINGSIMVVIQFCAGRCQQRRDHDGPERKPQA